MTENSIAASSGAPLDSAVSGSVSSGQPFGAPGPNHRDFDRHGGAMASRRSRRNVRMSGPTVFIFAPVEEARDSHKKLEAEGCELRLGKASWDTPQGNNEPELVRMARCAHALMGTSIRNVPISRRIMESSPELRIVAKYTIGVDDVDVEAATDMGILVCHGPTESNWGGVAEGTITAMLSMLKKVRERDRHLKDGGAWRDQKL